MDSPGVVSGTQRTRYGLNSSHATLRRRASKNLRLSYPRDVLWECIRCARCCGDTSSRERRILLLPSEAYHISRTTALVVEDFAEPTEGAGLYVLRMRKKDGRCVFLDGNRCSIYAIRPLVCRFYPVWLRKEGSTHTFGITDDCPGLGKGKRLDRDYYVSLLRLAHARLNVP